MTPDQFERLEKALNGISKALGFISAAIFLSIIYLVLTISNLS